MLCSARLVPKRRSDTVQLVLSTSLVSSRRLSAATKLRTKTLHSRIGQPGSDAAAALDHALHHN